MTDEEELYKPVFTDLGEIKDYEPFGKDEIAYHEWENNNDS